MDWLRNSINFMVQNVYSQSGKFDIVNTIEMLMNRKRSYGNQSPEVALLSELGRLEFEARGYHGQKA